MTVSSLSSATQSTLLLQQKSVASSQSTVASQTAAVAASSQTSIISVKSFAQVIVEARAALDQNYKTIDIDAETLETYDCARFEGVDRRSLYAICSDATGLFTAKEKMSADMLMWQQHGAAILAATKGGENWYKASMAFLDSVSDEEKKSVQWATDRAGSQSSYELQMRQQGKVAENVDSGNPLVNMLVAAMTGIRDSSTPRATSWGGSVQTLDDLRNEPLFNDGYFSSQLENAISQWQKWVSETPRVDVTA